MPDIAMCKGGQGKSEADGNGKVAIQCLDCGARTGFYEFIAQAVVAWHRLMG